MKFEIQLTARNIEEMRIKDCVCGCFHLENCDGKIHLDQEALFLLYEKLESAIDFIQNPKVQLKKPDWFFGLHTNSSKHA